MLEPKDTVPPADGWQLVSNNQTDTAFEQLSVVVANDTRKLIDDEEWRRRHKGRSRGHNESFISDVSCLFGADIVLRATTKFPMSAFTDARSPFHAESKAKYAILNGVAYGEWSNFCADLRNLCHRDIPSVADQQAVIHAVIMLMDNTFACRCLDDLMGTLGCYRLMLREHRLKVHVTSTVVTFDMDVLVLRNVGDSSEDEVILRMYLSWNYNIPLYNADGTPEACSVDRGSLHICLAIGDACIRNDLG